MKNLLKFMLVFPLLAVCCSGIKVTADYDKRVDFSRYKTFKYYGWAKNSDTILNRFDKFGLRRHTGRSFSTINYIYEQYI